LSQTDGDFEVVVVDDGSTDDSAAVASRYTDPRVKLLRQENRGLPAARNTALAHCDAEAISFLDADDLLLPAHLESLGAALRAHPEIAMASGRVLRIDERGRELTGGLQTDVVNGAALLLGNPFTVGTCMVRRAAVEQVGCFDETLVAAEDWDLWVRLALAGYRFHRIDVPVHLYRHYEGQMTTQGARMRDGQLKVLDKVFARPDLPPDWSALRGRAYGSIYAGSAARWFLEKDGEEGARDLRAAARNDPGWTENGGAALAHRLIGWAFSPRCREPLTFLEFAYDNLPEEFVALRTQRRARLAAAARQAAAEAFVHGREKEGRSFLRQAIRYSPALSLDRGVLSPLARSHLRSWTLRG
jgi:glycosyltransferase involved in cell wall biosynthesis